jgi:hypothetical protein
MLPRTLSGVVVVCLAVLPAAAQPRPDFSGTWTAVKEAPASVGAAPSPVFGATFGLKHERNTLTIVRTIREQRHAVEYVLDGREVRSRVPAPLCMGQVQSIETGAWDGNAIAMTIVGSQPAGAAEPVKRNVRRTFRLEAPDTLVVEATMSAGTEGAVKTVGTVYKRSSEPVVIPAPSAPKLDATIAQAAWLAGTWSGTAGKNELEERWLPPVSGSMMAMARTTREGMLTEFEFLCLVERDGGLVYQAMPNGRQPATDFTLTAVDANSLTFENPAHDFPKMIKYVLKPDGTLEATISGAAGQRALTFRYKKQ